jgi:hypothetical protein
VQAGAPVSASALRSAALRIIGRHHRRAVVALVAVLLLGLGASSALAAAPRAPAVPTGFVGMNVDGPLLDGSLNLPPILGQMASSGVESIRVVFSWAQAQPAASDPIDFSATDRILAEAVAHGLTVLPVVIYAPAWDSAPHPAGTYAAPARDGPYAAYLTALIRRYGPRGSFWAANPRLARHPIRQWQIWNEPNFEFFWGTRPFAPSYVSLLRSAHAAVHRADPGAKVVLAGLPQLAWDYLEQIYSVRGARGSFDIVAAHPYTAQPANVIRFLDDMHRVMIAHGDGNKPMLVTETGWNSTAGQASDDDCCQTTRSGQAHDIAALLPLLVEHRVALRLQGFYLYTWAAREYPHAPSFNFAGLFDAVGDRLVAKPAFTVFRQGALAMEHCRRKALGSTRCAATTR